MHSRIEPWGNASKRVIIPSLAIEEQPLTKRADVAKLDLQCMILGQLLPNSGMGRQSQLSRGRHR